jgi:hypothetical protein
LVEQRVYDELFDDGPWDLSVGTGRPVTFLVASLLDRLNALVIGVDLTKARELYERAQAGGIEDAEQIETIGRVP